MTSVGVMASAVVTGGACTDELSEPFDNLFAWTGTGTSRSLVAGRTGSALSITASSDVVNYSIASANQTDTLTVGFAWRRTDANTTVRDIIQLYSDTNTTQHNRLTYTPSTTTLAFTRGATTIASNAAVTFTQNTWYYIEVQTKLADTGGFVIVKVNGTEQINTTSLDTKNAGTKTVYDTIRLTPNASNPGQWDDLYLSTGSGCSFKGSQTIVATGSPPFLLEDGDNFTDAPWTTAGTVTISASGHTGNAFSIAAANTNTVSFNIPSPNQTDRITFGAWVRWAGLSASTQPYFQWRSDSGATLHMELRFDNSGFTEMRRGAPVATVGNLTSGTGIVANTWYYLEAAVRIDNTNGGFAVRLNGTPINTWQTDDTYSTGGTKTVIDQFRIVGHSSGILLVDDIYLRSDGLFGAT